MIFADINWLNISINLLLVVFVIVCLLMALLILMQRPKQEGLGAAFGGGVTDQVFGARTTNVLQRGTVYLGSMFFILALALAILIGKQSQRKSLLDTEKPVAAVEASEKSVAKPEEEAATSLADELPVVETPAPAAEVAPVVEEENTVAPVEVPAETNPAEAIPVEEAAPEPAEPAVEENNADKPE